MARVPDRGIGPAGRREAGRPVRARSPPRARPWAAGELPADVTPLGPRGAARLARPGGDARGVPRVGRARPAGRRRRSPASASWTPERRFDRAFERLALPGFARAPRFEFLLTAGALGLADLRPGSLQLLADPRDPVLAAAKRVFGIGDPIVVERRAADLAAAAACRSARSTSGC